MTTLDLDIYVERVPHSGALILSTWISVSDAAEYRHVMTYYGYSRAQAIAAFTDLVTVGAQ